MRHSIFFMLVLMFASCKPKEHSTTTAATVTSPMQPVVQDSTDAKKQTINCQTTGTLIESFNQNNSTFERFEIKDKQLEWLKITPKTGGCTILDNIREANHYSCRFEDWDGDGFKDRIDQGKWNYEVNLFSKEKNDFSRKIEGYYNGQQWDFDKTKGLKWQFLEDKFGGIYELYKMNDVKKVIYSHIHFRQPEDAKVPEIDIRKNFKTLNDELKFDVVTFDKSTFLVPKSKTNNDEYVAQLDQWRKSAERYWRKNIAQIVH
jgi:hypothetical protein